MGNALNRLLGKGKGRGKGSKETAAPEQGEAAASNAAGPNDAPTDVIETAETAETADPSTTCAAG